MLGGDAVSTGSIMPAYPWLFEQVIDKNETRGKIRALRAIGVPYPVGYEDDAYKDRDAQEDGIASGLRADGIEVAPETEIVALIAYLQRLGRDIKGEKTATSQR